MLFLVRILCLGVILIGAASCQHSFAPKRQAKRNPYDRPPAPISPTLFADIHKVMNESYVLAGEGVESLNFQMQHWLVVRSDTEAEQELKALPGEQLSALKAFAKEMHLEFKPHCTEILNAAKDVVFPAQIATRKYG